MAHPRGTDDVPSPGLRHVCKHSYGGAETCISGQRASMQLRLAWRVERGFFIAVCAIALVVGVIPVPAIAQVQWKMATEYPESNISGVGLTTFGKLLASNTHGYLTTVNAFDNEMKVSSGEMLRAAQDNRIAGGDAFAGPLEASDPIFGLSSLPFVVQSIDSARAVNARARFP
jgi:TRAP-type C4-dicarboxylate transport system substrate-binding protein